MPTGHIAGDTMGNVAMVIHILIAAVVTLGGPLQLIPRVRASFPAFHRWNGRVETTTVVVTSITGLYLGGPAARSATPCSMRPPASTGS